MLRNIFKKRRVNMKVELGSKVRDMITGLEGVVMARTEYLTGCAHIAIMPQKLTDKGEIPEYQWIDETRAEILSDNAVKLKEPAKKDSLGGPEPNAPSL
jgi:hypothetical protein